MRLPSILIAFCPAVALAASLSIAVEDPAIEGADLDEGRIFARIDSLEASLPSDGGGECAVDCFRLGQLYLSLDSHENNWIALEYLDRALEENPRFFDAAKLRARAMWDMDYERDARLGFEELTRDYPADARPHWMLGQLHFRRGRTVLDARDFERARTAYLGAVQLDPASFPALHGLAASQLALERWTELLVTARGIGELLPGDPLADFLSGAAFSALGERAEAERAFQRALERSDATTRAVFENGDGFLDEHALRDGLALVVDSSRLRERMREVDEDWESGDRINHKQARQVLEDPAIRSAVVDDFWRSVNTWPSHVLNSRQLLFWQRLVEADVLFGDPESRTRGWDTWPGRVLARWGRPDRIHYEPPSFHAHHATWYDQDVRLPVGESIPNDQQVMVWTYRRDGNWFSLLFTDVTQRFRWHPTNASTEAYESRVRTQPLIFFDGEEQPRFELDIVQNSYPRAQYTRLESSIAVRSAEDFEPFERLVDDRPENSLLTVEWALYDWTEQRVEYVRRELDDRHRRASLLRALGRDDESGENELVCQINAALPPGEYRLAVDVSSPSLGHRAQQMRVMVPDVDPPGFLNISDLLLAESFEPVRAEQEFPLEFVRYAHGVVPRPSRRFVSGSGQAHVYFELYNLVTDERGLTRFNIHYRIHRVRDRRVPERGQVLDPSTLEFLELASTSFLEESTGLSMDGHVVKGSALDLRSLERGEYLLEIQIEDLLADQSTSRYVRFSVRGS